MTIIEKTPSFESEKSHPRRVDKIQLEIGPFLNLENENLDTVFQALLLCIFCRTLCKLYNSNFASTTLTP